MSCVDLGLDAFGVNMKEATYSALSINDDLRPCEMFEFPDAFTRALKEVFGAGYVMAERSVIKELQKKFSMTSPASAYSIADVFRIARRESRKKSNH